MAKRRKRSPRYSDWTRIISKPDPKLRRELTDKIKQSSFVNIPPLTKTPEGILIYDFIGTVLSSDLRMKAGLGRYKEGGECINIAFPTETPQSVQRKWLKIANRQFRKPRRVVILKKIGKILKPVKLTSEEELKAAYGSRSQQNREFYKKRNQWIRSRYRELRKTDLKEFQAYDRISEELKQLPKDMFGPYSFKEKDPFVLEPDTIRSIIQRKNP